MFAQTCPSIGNPFGRWEIPAMTVLAVSVGKICRFYGASTLPTNATDANYGAIGKYYAYVKEIDAAQLTADVGNIRLEHNFVCMGTTTAEGQGRFCVKGRVQALVDGTTDVAVGDILTVNASGHLVKATADDTRVVAKALEARTANSAGLQWVEFNGEGVFGLPGNLV